MNVVNSSTLDHRTSPSDFDPKGPLRVPDYMEPTIFRSSGLPEIDEVLEDVRRILQGEESDPSPGEGNKTTSPVPQPRPVEQSAPEPDQPVRYYQVRGSDSRLVILVDFSDTIAKEDTSSAEYDRIVEALRASGRELLADEVFEMLIATRDDPSEIPIKLYSLQQMAVFLLENRGVRDPIVGPNLSGVMQAEWKIFGDGLLVLVFWGEGQVHCVVRVDATTNRAEVRESVRLSPTEAMEKFGDLVPLS